MQGSVPAIPTSAGSARPTEARARSRSLRSETWRRFVANKMAVVGLVVICLVFLGGTLGPMVAPYHYEDTDALHALEGPSREHLFGTDQLGRDLFSRVLYSMRNALIVGFGAQGLVVVIGFFVGAIAGYRGGLFDTVLMRIVDVMYSFPTFFLNILLMVTLGRSLMTVILAIGITGWAGIARLVRGQVLSVKKKEYVEAARVTGATDMYIILTHILPNIAGPLIVAITFGIPGAMMAESGLSLLGMGVPPPMPSWGALISEGSSWMLGSPHLLIWPALTFAITLVSFTFVGDGLREALVSRG